MAKILYVLGNGFGLAHELETKLCLFEIQKNDSFAMGMRLYNYKSFSVNPYYKKWRENIMARNANNIIEKQHIRKIMSELLNYNAFLDITLVNLTKIKCQLISINAKESSGEIKVKNINGDTITIDILDIYAVTQGITF